MESFIHHHNNFHTFFIFHLRTASKLLPFTNYSIGLIQESLSYHKKKDPQTMIFCAVEDPALLLPILEKRLPQACFIHNQVILFENFKEDLSFYTLGNEINSHTWIVSIYIREDYGCYTSISAPASIFSGEKPIPVEVKEAFSSENLIRWNDGIRFVALEKAVSSMIFDISVNSKGNVTEVHPCILYYMEKEEALQLQINPSKDLEVRRLHPEKEYDFILKTWLYSKEGSDTVLRKNIKGAASGGVFVNGKCVSGVITPGNGLISSLYTLKEYRNRGYGKLTMKYALKESASERCIPCLTVELRNEGAIVFQQSLGMKVASIVDWIDLKKLNVDVD